MGSSSISPSSYLFLVDEDKEWVLEDGLEWLLKCENDIKRLCHKVFPKNKISKTANQNFNHEIPCLRDKSKRHKLMLEGMKEYKGAKRFSVTMLSLYAKFMTIHSGKRRKELKRIIDNIEDVPGFFKRFKHETEDYDFLAFLAIFVCFFLERHKCRNCPKYSLDKCSACNWAHYCSVKCQEEDFEKHSKVCINQEFLIHNLVEADIRARLNIDEDKHMLTIDSFISKLSFKSFESFFELLSNPESYVNMAFRERFQEYNVRYQDLKVLLRNKPTSKDTFYRQLEDSGLMPDLECNSVYDKTYDEDSAKKQRSKKRTHAR